ncbi:MAG: hypothetical protein KIT11_00170 [Fimbriimonadaceae bacterium]|nr:hypothetical protein [Fimbriimonadaceae bacterium]QYK55211.1 MAG: hypothetical protein KF733_09365 [Fimbriimonadaceae bacterium]
MLIIDNFDGGDFERVFRQPGSYGDIIRNIDPRDTIGGSRQYGFRLFQNLGMVDVVMENRAGRHQVAWPTQRPNVLCELYFDYGAGDPMEVDMGFATSIQVDRDTTPDEINATGYTLFLRDADGRSANNIHWRQRPDQGIEFFRSDFSRQIDWSRIEFVRFLQTYDNFSGTINEFRTLEIHAVPEPATVWFVSVSLTLAFSRARRNRARPQALSVTFFMPRHAPCRG